MPSVCSPHAPSRALGTQSSLLSWSHPSGHTSRSALTDRRGSAPAAGTLDLGEVAGISEVTLNGKPIGTRWYGQHIYDTSDAAKQGSNELIIKVTTVMHNHVRTLDKNTCAGFWTRRNKNPVSTGLIGPVKIGYK